jgi:hypothetical protein
VGVNATPASPAQHLRIAGQLFAISRDPDASVELDAESRRTGRYGQGCQAKNYLTTKEEK